MSKIPPTNKSVKELLAMLKSLEFIMTQKLSVTEVIFSFYSALLYIFFHVHDPTTLNRQGNDVGTQYRSTVMYETEEEKNTAHSVIEEVTKEGKYPGAPGKIVTEVVKMDTFY